MNERFAEAYLREMGKARDDIAAMKAAKLRGDVLAPGLPDVVSTGPSFRFLDDLPSRSPENDAWDIDFGWEPEQQYATFTVWFAPTQNMGGDEPTTGWVSWAGEGLLIAFIDLNGPGHDALHLPSESPFTDDTSTENPRAWLELARLLLRAIFGEMDTRNFDLHR